MRSILLALAAAACAGSPSAAPERDSAPVTLAPESVPSPAIAPVVLHRDGAPRRGNPLGTAIITPLARGGAAFVGLLTLAPGARVPEHQDPTEEYLYVLSGGGEVTIDGVVSDLRPGVAVLMPAGATVSYVNGPELTEVVQVFAGPGPADKYDGWADIGAAP